MKKNIIAISVFVLSTSAFGQVGINTPIPNRTWQISLGCGASGNCSSLPGNELFAKSTQVTFFRIGD
ncbi:hypothetical protein [Chryseobacterium joostei]|uniref:hypothetical protein n=1 Tax=Chryseobacterium joostei TaxID=112234 RepID=UPI003D0EDD44